MSVTKTPILIQDDPWLAPYEREISERMARLRDYCAHIEQAYGGLDLYAKGYHFYGFNYDPEQKGWWYREWAPAAAALSLVGDFNNWDRQAHPMEKDPSGVWTLFLPDQDNPGLTHGSKLKVHVVAANGSKDRIPVWINRVIQDPETHDFSGQLWHPPDPYRWKNRRPDLKAIGKNLLIYEAHTGMGQEKEGVGTYREFMENVLPRVKANGYTAIQLMAIQEHPYYGSFGYHVSSYFAPSSRFGTPEELKELIDAAHGLGIAVILDIVHSHAVKNIAEGMNDFDGSDNLYFHKGERGEHPGWDSKLFDYGREEVMRFLVSNCYYWLTEFQFDGFRFDGITSMLYHHHGTIAFDHYDHYFKGGVDQDAVLYLQLANKVAHTAVEDSITIAEDMSGMPGLCRRQEEGGIGFDFRLGMGIPDYWIKLLKHCRDEDWNIHEVWDTLNNRRWKEKTIAYAESHDQALVGDKTLAFWLMDQEMYWHMKKEDEHLVIDRGVALHKLIRFLTISIGGEGYMNFMGNEFGHPEWVDFPREGNGWSYQYARRQWSLVDNKELKYDYLNNFDKALLATVKEGGVLAALPAAQLNMDTTNRIMIYERNNLIFVVNLHVDRAIPGYRFKVPASGDYRIVLNSDDRMFGGFGRIDNEQTYPTDENGMLSIYLTNRTALVLKKD